MTGNLSLLLQALARTLGKFDEFVKSPKNIRTVIPAKAGIQRFQGVTKSLDPGLRRDDDFLRIHQV
ncbi:MAG: hypothetical protein KKA60_15715 [Proteobacteria bacterium]|nr:hypothetical protein [Pseudomonadota bacterium]